MVAKEVPFTQLPQMLAFYIITVKWSKLGN